MNRSLIRQIGCSLLLLCGTLYSNAQTLAGIALSCDRPVVFFVNGTQVSLPAQSCFIADLGRGNYRIEARQFAQPNQIGPIVYSTRIDYPGEGVTRISFKSGRHHPNHSNLTPQLMRPKDFDRLLQTLHNESFDKDRYVILETMRNKQPFTTEQIGAIARIFDFDDARLKSLKLLYPCAVDPGNYYTLLETLDFLSSKNELQKFLKEH